jgi:hypothetical protein
VGVIVELFDSNSMDSRTRISFNFFCSEAGEASAIDGTTGGVGVFGARATTGEAVGRVEGTKAGAFGARATSREGFFLNEGEGE